MYMYCTCIRRARGVYPVMMRRQEPLRWISGLDRVVKKVSRAAGKKSGRVTLVGRYMNAMFSSLGFLLVGVEIAEFEFTACIRYRFTNPMCLQRA